MKKWEQNLVAGVFAIALGVIMVAWDCQAVNPIEIKLVGGQFSAATLNTTFIGLLLTGSLLVGIGIGEARSAYTLHRLEKQLV